MIKLIMASAELPFISDCFGIFAFYMKSGNKEIPNSASCMKEDCSMTELIAQFLRNKAP